MRLKSFKGLSLGKMKEKEEESGVVIEGTTAEQLAEMQKRMDDRKKELENATKQLRGLSVIKEAREDEEEAIGPHGPIQELTIEDVPDDDEDFLFLPPENEETFTNPEPRVIAAAAPAAESKSPEDSSLKDLLEVTEEVDNEEDDADENEQEKESDGLDLSDSFGNLFDEDESDENPLTNLINNLPDVSAQELLDDIEEIKQIIKEWQQQKFNV